jgi:hypothetical protein
VRVTLALGKPTVSELAVQGKTDDCSNGNRQSQRRPDLRGGETVHALVKCRHPSLKTN